MAKVEEEVGGTASRRAAWACRAGSDRCLLAKLPVGSHGLFQTLPVPEGPAVGTFHRLRVPARRPEVRPAAAPGRLEALEIELPPLAPLGQNRLGRWGRERQGR